MSEKIDDTPLPLAKLAEQIPPVRGEKPPHRATLYKWATIGLKTSVGRVLLATQFIGGTRCASQADLRKFFEAKREPVADVSRRSKLTQREQAEMRRRGEEAGKWLEAIGA